MKRLLIFAATAAITIPASAITLYNSTTQTGSRFNPGKYEAVDTLQAITFDDALIPVARYGAGNLVNVTQVSVGIRRVGSVAAPTAATNVEVYWANDSSAVAGAFLSGAPNLIGTVSLGSITTSATTVVTFGDAINTLFSAAANETDFAGFGNIFIGVRFTSPDATNGWRLTTNPGPDSNVNAMVLFDGEHNQQGVFGFGSTGPSATFYMDVQGNGVPEPATLAALALGVAALAVRRFRK